MVYGVSRVYGLFPANQVGRCENVWGLRGYGVHGWWVKRVSTVHTWMLEMQNAMSTRWAAWGAMQMHWVGTRTCLASRWTQIQLQSHQQSSEWLEREGNCPTYLLKAQNGSQMSQMGAGTMRTHRVYTQAARTLKPMWKQLETRRKPSVYAQ